MIFLQLLRPIGIDFPQYYDAAYMILHGLNPYKYLLTSPGPFNYPPPVFLFIFWLGLGPPSMIGPVWNFLSLASLLLSIYFLLKLADFSVRGYLFLFLVALFTIPFFPVKFNFGNGQINTFLLFFVSLSFYLYLRGRKPASAMLLALAAGIKLIPVIFLLYFLIKRDWHYLAQFIICLVLVFLLPFFFIPWSVQVIYYLQVFGNAFGAGGKAIYYNQSLLGFLSRSLTNQSVATWLNYFLSLVLVGATFFRGKKINSLRLLAAVSCLYLLINPLAWQHHFVFALIPLVLLGVDLAKTKKDRSLWLAVVASYLLLAIDIKNFLTIPIELRFILSHDFYAVLALWLFALWQERFWTIVSVVWISAITVGYILILLCRARICF